MPAARLIDEHGCAKLRAWMGSPRASAPTPEAALGEAQEAARAARVSETKVRSQLGALQRNMTAEIARRVELHSSRVEAKVSSQPRSNPSDAARDRSPSRALPPF